MKPTEIKIDVTAQNLRIIIAAMKRVKLHDQLRAVYLKTTDAKVGDPMFTMCFHVEPGTDPAQFIADVFNTANQYI